MWSDVDEAGADAETDAEGGPLEPLGDPRGEYDQLGLSAGSVTVAESSVAGAGSATCFSNSQLGH